MTHLGFHHRMHFHHCFQQCCQTRQYALQIPQHFISINNIIIPTINGTIHFLTKLFTRLARVSRSLCPCLRFSSSYCFFLFSFFPFLVTQLAFSPSRFCFLVVQPFFHLFQKYWFSLFQDVIMPFLSRLFFFLKINNVHIFKRFMNYP